jgi:hypothetical protein
LPENVTVPEQADAFGAASAEGSGSTRGLHGIGRAIVTVFPIIEGRPAIVAKAFPFATREAWCKYHAERAETGPERIPLRGWRG